MNKSIYSQDQKKLVEKIKNARKEAGIGQLEAAQKLNKSQSYISKVESGQLGIDVIELKAIAKIYKKKIEDFIK